MSHIPFDDEYSIHRHESLDSWETGSIDHLTPDVRHGIGGTRGFGEPNSETVRDAPTATFNPNTYPNKAYLPAGPSLPGPHYQYNTVHEAITPTPIYDTPDTTGLVPLEAYGNDNLQSGDFEESFSQEVITTRQRPGRGGRLLCPDCRRRKKGFECDRDDEDPASCCSACKKKGLPCGPRTLPPGRMESIRGKIRDNRFTEISKWTAKDLASLLKQLPDDEAERLSAMINIPTPRYSNTNINDLQSSYFPIGLEINDRNDAIEHQIAYPQTENDVHEYPSQSSPPIDFPNNFTNLSQYLRSPKTYPELTSPFVPPTSIQNYQSSTPFTKGQYINPDQISTLEYNNNPVLEEDYPPTMSDEDLATQLANIASPRFRSTNPTRLYSLFLETIKMMEKANQENATHSL